MRGHDFYALNPGFVNYAGYNYHLASNSSALMQEHCSYLSPDLGLGM